MNWKKFVIFILFFFLAFLIITLSLDTVGATGRENTLPSKAKILPPKTHVVPSEKKVPSVSSIITSQAEVFEDMVESKPPLPQKTGITPLEAKPSISAKALIPKEDKLPPERTVIFPAEKKVALPPLVTKKEMNPLAPSEVWVDDDFNSSTPGWGYDHFSKIQNGVTAVAVNGIVYVADGTYIENVLVDKPCSLIGSGYPGCVVDANSIGNGFSLSADNILLKGFKIINARGNNICGVFIGGTMPGMGPGYKHITVRENEVSASNSGIYLWHSDSNFVVKNIVHNCPDDMSGYGGVGIILWDGNSYNTIDSNKVYSNDRFGVFLGYSDDTKLTNYNTLSYNQIFDNGQNTSIDGTGLMLQNADYNTISWNKVYDNTDATHDFQLGIYLQGSSDYNQVLNNEVNRNKTGVGLYINCTHNSIIGNQITCNNLGAYKRGIGIFDAGSSNNTVYQNILFSNPINARDNGSNNLWDNGVNTGNFWDDLASNSGYPTQYNVPGTAGSIDHYPMSSPTVVWVDDNWAGTPCGDSVSGHLFGYDAFAKIQDGIDRVGGSTVNVLPGTYNESDTIRKSLTLNGDPGDATPGPGPSAPVLDGTGFSGSPAFCITQGVSNVTIQGFEIRNYGPNGNTNADGVVAWNSGTSNVTIRDNYIHHLGYSGVLTGNGWGGSQGLHDNWQVTYNVVQSTGAYGFDMENVKNSIINHNVISGLSWYTINVIALATEPGASVTSENVEVKYNTITGCTDRNINLFAWTDGGADRTAMVKNVTVANNTVSGNFNLIVAWKTGPGTNTIRDLTIDNNSLTVNNPKSAEYTVNLADVAGISSFSGNTITLTGAIGGGGTFFHGVNVLGSATGTWNMTGNQLDGNSVGSASCGYRLRNSLPSTSVLNITGNSITEFARGISSDLLPGGATVDVHNSKIFGNSLYGVSNGAGAIIDAENNWWDSNCGPYHPSTNPRGQGNAVSDNVDYEPWCNQIFTKCDFTTTPPDTVWVDDNYTPAGYNDGHFWCYDAFDKIEDGIAAVVSGGTVNVASGTYNVVQIRIGKAVSLLGAGSATTIIDGGKSNLNAYGDGTVLITSSATGTIIIDGFTLQNPGYTGTVPDDWVLTMVDYINTATVTVQNCHFVGYGPSDPDHWDYAFYVVKNNGGTVTVQNNEFEQMWAAVLIELPEGPVKILNNNIHHLQSQIYPPEPPPIGPVYSAYGVFATTYGGLDVPHLQQVNGNTFSDYAGRCIHFVGGYPDVPEVNKFTNVEIKNNTIKAIGTGPENQHAGIILANAGTTPAEAAQGGVDNAIISGNIMKGTGGTDSYGIRLRGPNNNPTIYNNTIKGVNKGIAVEEWYSGAGRATGLTVYNNILMCNTTNALDDGTPLNAWDNGSVGNFWDDWASNSGYPTQYNVPGTAASVDHYPQAPMVVWVDDDWVGTACGDSVSGHLFGYDAFARVQEGVDGVAPGGTVDVAAGTYEEQVVIKNSNLTLAGAGAGGNPTTHTIIKSPVTLTWFFTTSAKNYPVVGINSATDVTIQNMRVDGAGRGNSNYRFVGVGFWNGDGSVTDCEVIGIRDNPFSGAQHGNGIYSYNNGGGPYTINVTGTKVEDFQKNGMSLSGNNLTANVANCTVKGKGLTSVTAQNGIQIGFGAGGSVTNCSVSDIGYTPATWIASGILLYNGTTVNVTGSNSVSASQASVVYQETQGSVDGITINSANIDAAEGISIRDYGYVSLKGSASKRSAVPVSPFEDASKIESKPLGTPTTVTINNATIVGVHHVGSYGVAAWSLGDNVNLNITNSEIRDWEIGVVAYEEASAVNSTASHNKISSNDMGFWTNAASVQNSEANWWGSYCGPYHPTANPNGQGNEVSDGVDFVPWCDATLSDCTLPHSPAIVWVNDDWTGTACVDSAGGHLFGVDAFNKIQDGLDAVASSGTVNVLKGTYNENIVISKPLSLLGAGQDSVLVYPAISDIGQPNPDSGSSFRGSQMCVVQATDVTIDGFTFDGNSPSFPAPIDARNGIITNYKTGDWSNLKVQNCTVKNIYLRGIYAAAQNPNNLTGVDFNHNTVSNVKGWSMQSAGIMLWGSSGTVSQNQISNTSLGVFYHNYSDGTIMWNTVANSEVCLGVNSNDSPTSISYNKVVSSSQGIQTISTLSPVDVKFNSITSCSTGVVLYGGGTAQVNLWDDTIKGLNTYATYGVYASTNLDPWGLGELHANLKRNIIKDNFDGIVLNEPSGDRSKTLSVLIGGASSDRNFIYNNLNYELLLEYCNDNQTATYNYWGKSTYAQIEEEIYHKVDQPDLGLVTFDPAILHGDVNLDGKLTVADVVYLINYLFKGGPAPQLFIVADVNRDGSLTVADAVYLINYLFKGGPAPKVLVSESLKPGMGRPLVEKPKLIKPVDLHSVEK